MFSTVGTGFSTAFSNALTGIKNIWNNVTLFFSSIWSGITNVFSSVGTWFFNTFNAAWQSVVNIWKAAGSWFGSIFQGITTTIGNLFTSIISAIKRPINTIISGINSVLRSISSIKVPDWVPGFGGASISFGQIPYLARGGVVSGGQLFVAGEAGREAIVPLENNLGWITKVAEKLVKGLRESGLDRVIETLIVSFKQFDVATAKLVEVFNSDLFAGGFERTIEIPIPDTVSTSAYGYSAWDSVKGDFAGSASGGGDTYNINMNVEGKTLRDMNTLSQFADMAKIKSRMTAGVNY